VEALLLRPRKRLSALEKEAEVVEEGRRRRML